MAYQDRTDSPMTPMRTSALGVRFICRWEAFRATPYRDQAGHLTWGYGHCQKAGEQPPAAIDIDAALALMESDLQPVERTIVSRVERHLTQSEFDALVSLGYNIGPVALAGSTLLRLVNAGRIDDAAKQFLQWSKVRNPKTGMLEPSSGLLARRKAERTIFLGGLYNWDH